MSQYNYSLLSLGHDSIRLLCLLPDVTSTDSIKRTEIQYKLFEYTLQDPGAHYYEALSYTWGGSDKPRSISTNKQNLAVTENLYAVLLRLRECFFERILWIDAISINQET
jgi:hypothetical protein